VIARYAVLGIALVAMIGAPAQVQAEPDYGRPGVYVGAAFALGFDNFDTGPLDWETALGVDFWVGYRIIPNLAAELEIEYLAGFVPIVSGFNPSVDAVDFSVNVKAYLLTGRIQPFGLLGIGITDVFMREFVTDLDMHTTAFSGRFGGGVDMYVTENFSVGLLIPASCALAGELREFATSPQ